MKIAIIGGTGNEGKGIAMRWAKAGHEVTIGSRSAERAATCAAELSEKVGATIKGDANEAAAKEAEIVLLSVPYGAHAKTLEGLKEALQGKIMIDITVPLQPPKVRQVFLPEGNAACLEAQAILGDGVQVVAAMHHISAMHLADLDHTIDCDVLVCGKKDARAKVVPLMADLGLNGIDAGPLRNAVALESLTPVLLHINRFYKAAGAGIRITGIPKSED